MALSPEQQKAFDFASDATKQLITVATGVVTATVLFSSGLDTRSRAWGLASWIALTLSVVFGLMTLLNLTGNLQNATDAKPASINAKGIRQFSQIQIALFLVGVVLMVAFGFFATKSTPVQPITVTCTAPGTGPTVPQAKP